MIYHIVPEPEFLDCFNGDVYIPLSLRDCGFVHCALRESVVPVANDFFATLTDKLLLLEIDPARLDAEVKYEPAAPVDDGGTSHLDSSAVFPHIYGPVNSAAIVASAVLNKTSKGYRWPSDDTEEKLMTKTAILHAIGNTPLVALKHVVPGDCARVLVKLESQNPTGSMKDRMARAVIESAIERGALLPGGTVVEYTGGSTGTSLAFVCAAMGYALSIVTADAFSQEKRDHMRALGADVEELQSEDGRTTKALIQGMIARAAELSTRPGHFFADQFNNPDAATGYATLTEELWRQSGQRVDAFVQSVGTAQCITGVANTLRKLNGDVHIVAVEPAESAVLAGGSANPHGIEGVGPGFVPPRWSDDLADDIIPVSTADAKNMARRLAKEEALFAGTSTGANVLAAIRVAERLGPGHTVATLACDTGLKYLSTDLYTA